jgi:4-hydroxy-tetrahydrodipicolinate synthase
MPPYRKHEARDWAWETMRGCANVITPTFTQDLQGLNEAAIRHDVRWEIEHGFWGALLVAETATTSDEYVQFAEWSVDEANGRLHFLHHASFNTLQENIDVATRVSGAGAELVLLSYPPTFYPKTSEDIYEYSKAFCDATDMAVMLFPVPLWGFERLHGASIDPAVIVRLVDECPNIVAVKAEGGFPSIAGFADCRRLVGDRVIVTMPVEDQVLPAKLLVDIQWTGTSFMEYFGSSVPDIFRMIDDGEVDKGMELYWQIHPARQAAARCLDASGSNLAHRMMWKYMGWLSGLNGGPLRMPTMRINQNQMLLARRGLEAAQLDVTSDPDELFFVGRNPA